MTATDESADESVKQNSPGKFGGQAPLLTLTGLALILVSYYWPCLAGTGDFYISDLSFYFQPFCQFIGKELRAGILPLWNPHLYSGMSQLAVPSPALFYPPSFILFLLPFSLGLSVYMIVHQLIGAIGTYLFLRRAGASVESSCFAAVALCLCAYNFTLIQNFTLPATICWLPLALYFCDGIARLPRGAEAGSSPGDPNQVLSERANDEASQRARGSDAVGSDEGANDPKPVGKAVSQSEGAESRKGRKWIDVLGLTLTTSMIVYCGRPEVGVPALVLLTTLAVAHYFFSNYREDFKIRILALAVVGSSMLAGILLAAPILLPGIEWASLSPRALGLDAKWVLLWSANWYDWLGTVLANPLGSLYLLNDDAAHLRHLVLSRGGSIPFVASSYLSAIVFTLAFFGFCCKRKKLLIVLMGIFIVSFLMASGSATPFAPSIIKLSPALSAFRYPVKLVIVPCLVLILLAVLGIELILKRELPARAPKMVAAFWTVLLIGGGIAYNVPAIAPLAAKYLVVTKVPEHIPQMVQMGFAGSVVNSSLLGLLTCAVTWFCLQGKLKTPVGIYLLTAVLAGNLLWASFSIRQVGWAPYFSNPSFMAEQIYNVQKELKLPVTSRMVNLYFDPLTVPAEYEPSRMGKDQRFFAYARDMLLHNIVICPSLYSSFGYEAAETKDYKEYFTDAMAWSSQHSKANLETMTDVPIHRFMQLTATELVNTQMTRLKKSVPLLDKELFVLVKEDKFRNFRIFRVKNPRKRFFFANRIVPVESFADLKKVILAREKMPQTAAFDGNAQIVYVLNRDFFPNRKLFEAVNEQFKIGDESSPNKCDVVEQTSQALRIKCSAQQDGLLYMAEHYYPGWIADLDGQPVKIIKANGLNRAVIIPKGEHTLSLAYRPFVLNWGFCIAGIGVLMTGLMMLLVSSFEKSRP